MEVRFLQGAPKNAGRQVMGPPAAFQAEDRGVRLSLPAPIYGVASVVVAQLSVKQLGRVRFPASPQKSFCPCTLIGSADRLKICWMAVRICPGVPSF